MTNKPTKIDMRSNYPELMLAAEVILQARKDLESNNELFAVDALMFFLNGVSNFLEPLLGMEAEDDNFFKAIVTEQRGTKALLLAHHETRKGKRYGTL